MTDIPIKPHRKTLQQAAIILNVSAKTVRRYLDQGKLMWSGNQVSVESITIFLQTATPKDEDEAIRSAKSTSNSHQRPHRHPKSSGWVKNW